MVTGLKVWGVISGLYGLLVLSQAKSAVHEIEVGVAFLIATFSLGLAGVIEAVSEAEERLVTLGRKFDVLIAHGEASETPEEEE